MIKKALTIAGSDSGGGAGIQADLKTFAALGIYGTSVITSVTAQNTLGVYGIFDLPAESVALQIDSVLTDIGADAAKTGMLSNPKIIEVVCQKVEEYNLNRLVIDPVMVSTSGHRLITAESQDVLIKKLLPLAYLVTPNVDEAGVIAKFEVKTMQDMKRAAKKITILGVANVLVKGGHLSGDAVDVLFDGSEFTCYRSERLPIKNTHGTGCTFSAAITAFLAKGNDLTSAVKAAKDYTTNALRYAYSVGSGGTPLNHFYLSFSSTDLPVEADRYAPSSKATVRRLSLPL